jgi:hypothetical protein
MNQVMLFLLLISHVIADFIVQSPDTVNERFSGEPGKRILGNAKHAGVHLLTGLILLVIYFPSLMVVPVSLLNFVLHFAIDLIKSRLAVRHPFSKYSVFAFLTDQAGHLVFILLIVHFTGRYFAQPNPAVPNGDILLATLLVLTGLWGAGIFIQILLDNMRYKPYRKLAKEKFQVYEEPKKDGVPLGGFTIGILERLITITAVITNMVTLIGFLITVKSIARFKKFDDDTFVEYFIIGTFISILFAVLIGYMIRQLSIFPIIESGLMNN